MQELTKQLLSEVFNSEFSVVDQNGQPYQMTQRGDLSVLAYGYRAVFALRKARGWHFDGQKLVIAHPHYDLRFVSGNFPELKQQEK